MEFIERLMQKTVQLALPRRSKLKPKQKRLVRLGCAALAVMLAVGSVPFLRGFAAEEEASVSGSDIVSGSDSDIVSSGSDGAVVIDGGTAEPKPAKSAIGGINWQRMESVDDLSNAALMSKSSINISMVSSWVGSYLDAFMEENGYTDSSQLYFIYDYSGQTVDTTSRSQYGVSSGGANISSYADKILFYIPRVPYTGISITDASGAAYQSGDEINMNVGDTMTLTAVLEPAATNDKVVWKTGNNQVVTVNESSGVITAVGCGSTTVTAQVYDDAYTITVNVSGHPYIDPYSLPTNNWVLAASWEDLTNAAFVGRSNANTWRHRNSNKTIGGIPVRSAKLVYAYDSVSKVAYFLSTSSGTVTEETFDSTTKYYYIPQPATSFTYHPAEPATCSQHATIGYWTDQDGYKFLDANGQTPIDSIYDETSPFGEHVWGELAVTREPTCCEAGEGKHTCTKCGTIETVSVDPDSTKHSLTHHDAVPATCTGAGTKEHWECSLCNKRFRDDAGTQELINLTVNALGHDWGNDTWIWATDYSSASVTLTCGRCGAEKTLTDNELHIVTVVSEPTCTKNKVVRYAAEVQDDENNSIFYDSTSEDVEVPDTSLGHDWDEWFTTTPATCSAPGEKTRTCKNDPSHTETEEIPALTHNWYEWKDVEGYPGLQEHDCANCGEHETRIHPLLQFVVAAGYGQIHG